MLGRQIADHKDAVAETMRVPLYMMSAGDLGIEPGDVESALSNIMEMSAKWNAVLLLDEADVFLEQRSTHDLERNKLVSSKSFLQRHIFTESLYASTIDISNNEMSELSHLSYPSI